MGAYADIANLVYRYAELIDAGEFAGVGDMFADGEFVFGSWGEAKRGAQEVEAQFSSLARIYEDGTPRTRHVITNLIIEVDGDVATARSYLTVFQEVPVDSGALQPILAGSYQDEFRRTDGVWRFARRQTRRGLNGDLSAHLLR